MHRSHKHLSHKDAKPGPERPLNRVAPFTAAEAPVRAGAPKVYPYASGSVTRMRTPRSRAEDQRTNLRRAYQAFLRKTSATAQSADGARVGAPAQETHLTSYQSWPIRPYAASV
ncbi:hypothetical protein [Enorma burkinafasonensis]|uniref:hypothetical protein n=1 Tax=Enorma burkinafasonensis TaxID=2590867 RepID=UPI0026EDFFEB|nr:hypothetical protein [Enorma burkinafasonensis]MCI7730327.1 hypothetical protein [Enorma burkinafasonensis]